MADLSVQGPSIWVVSDGRAGIERQSLSLARALAAPERAAKLAHIRSDAHRDAPLRLTPSGWMTRLRPDFWPAPLAALPPDQRALLVPPWPDVWIATGRRSIAYSRWLKRASAGATLVVQTQDPKVSLSNFDLVIPPEHDALTGANVFPILGPPTWWSPEEIAAAQARFPELGADPGPRVLVSVGGDSKTHRMSDPAAARVEYAIRTAAAQAGKLWITVSRRTPDAMRTRLRLLAEETGARFWENQDRDGPNPYLAWLASCDAALVTEDSANMLADPAFFGKPVHLMKLEGGSPRFDRLHRGFIDRHAARWHAGKIETWSYPPIREAERAADEIMRRLLARRPAPA
ncbi:MAG: mitochondrial fission ELM1 family protein [Hyphomonadaceae bacterium]